MVEKQEYDSCVEEPNSATVAAPAVLLSIVALFLLSPAIAQINGTPSSVTSTNFGGHVNSTPGVPASVTSLGPNGVQPRSQFFTQPGCCVNPLVPGNPNPPLFQRRHRHQQRSFFPAGGAVYVPYAVPVEPEEADNAADENPPTTTVAAQRFSIAVAQDNLRGLLWTTIRHERVVTGRIVESRRKPKKKRLSLLKRPSQISRKPC